MDDLDKLLNETVSLRNRFKRTFTTGLSPQDVLLATAILRTAEGEEVKRLAAQKMHNELYVEWNKPDEVLIHLARCVVREAKELRLFLELNDKTVRIDLR